MYNIHNDTMQENTFINLYMWAQKFENVNLHMEHYLYFYVASWL